MDDHDRPSSDFFQEQEQCYYSDTTCNLATPGDDLFSILESLDDGFGFGGAMEFPPPPATMALDNEQPPQPLVFSSSSADQTELDETNSPPKTKRLKLSASPASGGTATTFSDEDGQQTRMSHITVERNRRKQMNDHLSVLRSLMPCFYVKRVSFSTHPSIIILLITSNNLHIHMFFFFTYIYFVPSLSNLITSKSRNPPRTRCTPWLASCTNFCFFVFLSALLSIN